MRGGAREDEGIELGAGVDGIRLYGTRWRKRTPQSL
jgi:hypothetical protein